MHGCGRGRNEFEGSEHYIEGKRYPLEIHFVHVNSKYADMDAALKSDQEDGILVVGQMFQLGDYRAEPPALTEIGNKVVGGGLEMVDSGVNIFITLKSLLDTCNFRF